MGRILRKKFAIYILLIIVIFLIGVTTVTYSFIRDKEFKLENETEIIHKTNYKMQINYPVFNNKKVNKEINNIIEDHSDYEFIFKDNLNKNFIHAKKYAELVVLKQFTTFFSDSFADSLGMRLEDHIARYGNNLIVCGNRMPYNDYLTIDKRYMDSLGLEFTADEIITELFHDVYSVMGIIDRIKKQDQDDE